jgi:hypothetical protein
MDEKDREIRYGLTLRQRGEVREILEERLRVWGWRDVPPRSRWAVMWGVVWRWAVIWLAVSIILLCAVLILGATV